MLTTKEISKMLNVSEETVRRWIRTGELEAIQNGKSYFVDEENLEKFVAKKATVSGTALGTMASVLPVLGVASIASSAIAGAALSGILNKALHVKTNTSDNPKISKKELDDYLEVLMKQKKELDDKIAEIQKLQDELHKKDQKLQGKLHKKD